MSSGKCAAQAAHAETLAMKDYSHHDIERDKLDPEDRRWVNIQYDLYSMWLGHGHYAKYVVTAEDSLQMHTIKHYLEERGYKVYLVIDEGHTEGTYFVPTAMAVELVDKDDERTASIFGEFKLYKDRKPPKKRSKFRRVLDALR